MAKTILVANQKGGVGKSLIADEIAFSLERTGVKFNFYDLDNQGGTIHTTETTEDAEYNIVDTPGALQSELADWLKGADVIVVPTRTTSRDIEPLCRMQRLIRANTDAPVVFVMNGWNRFKASKDFLIWFIEENDQQIIVKLPQSELFVQAGAESRSVVDYKADSRAAEATLGLVNSVRKLIGLPVEVPKGSEAKISKIENYDYQKAIMKPINY